MIHNDYYIFHIAVLCTFSFVLVYTCYCFSSIKGITRNQGIVLVMLPAVLWMRFLRENCHEFLSYSSNIWFICQCLSAACMETSRLERIFNCFYGFFFMYQFLISKFFQSTTYKKKLRIKILNMKLYYSPVKDHPGHF